VKINYIALFFIFLLVISGCELVEEREGPQLSMIFDEGDQSMQLPLPIRWVRNKVLNTPSCTDYNAFMPDWDASCSQEGIYNAPIFCGQTLTGTSCTSCYVESTSSYCNSEELGGCYCIGDGVCNDGVSAPDYGETTSSSDCEAPSHNECNGNNCVSVAGTGTDDCNNPGAIDPMCIVETHLECVSGTCTEALGAGSNQCSAVDDQCDKGVCLVGDVCQFVSGAVGDSECRVDAECSCGDGTCAVGENCNYDRGDCQDRQCLEPTCLDGCGETFVPNRNTDEACNNGYHCNGAGSCVQNVCGDGYCDIGENPANCQADCSCSAYTCQSNPWQTPCSSVPGCFCGNCHWAGGGGGIPQIWVCECLND
jgi:hypothetical protein